MFIKVVIILYWFFFLAFTFYMMAIRNYRLFIRISPFLLFTSVFFYFLIWLPQGLDITDEGYALTKSWFSLHGAWKDNTDIIWMSSLLNGLWLSIIGEPLVLWGRIGFVVIISLTSVFAFLILAQFFNRIKSFVAVFFLTAVYTINAFMSINYYNLPILLILISVYMLMRFIRANKNSLLISAGFFLAVLGFVKVTFYLAPVLYLIFLNYFIKEDGTGTKRIIKYSFIGLIAGYLLGFVLLLSTGSLISYIKNIMIATGLINNPFPTYEMTHTNSGLSSILENNFYRFSYTTLTTIFVIFIYLLSISFLKKKSSQMIVTSMLIYFAYLISYKGDSEQWEYLLISMVFAYLFFKLIWKEHCKRLDLLINMSLIVFILSFLGSNGGIRTGLQSGGMLMISAISILSMDNLNLAKFHFIKPNSTKYLRYVAFGFLLLLLYWKKPNDSYRERPRTELNTPFVSASLSGIVSNSLRVNAVDSLLVAFNRIRSMNPTLMVSTLTINSNPMFYYLANIRPYLSNPWFFSVDRFEQKLKNSKNPDILIFSLQNPRDDSWPKFHSKPCYASDSLDYNYFQEFVRYNNYYSAYQNEMFQIFVKPEFYFDKVENNIVNENLPSLETTYWEKLRPNCSILPLNSTGFAKTECELINEIDGGTAGIKKTILKINELYFVSAEVKSDSNATILLQAGGFISSIPKSVKQNEWTEIKGLLKASGDDFLIYAENLTRDCKISIRKIGVYKAVHKNEQHN